MLSAFTVCETVQVNAVLVSLSSVKQITSHKLVMCQLVQCVDKDNKLRLCRHSYSVHHSKCFKLGCRLQGLDPDPARSAYLGSGASLFCTAWDLETSLSMYIPRSRTVEAGEIYIFTARCTLVQSAVLRSHVVCLSVRPSVRLWHWWIVIT